MLSVLVVDPDPALASTIAEMLRACRHVAIALDDYTAGLKLLDTVAFDALIVSVDGSDVVSVSFAVAARSKQPSLFVVGVGNFVEQPTNFAKAEIDIFIGKPFSIEQIESSIRDLIGPLQSGFKFNSTASLTAT
jgi:DNA-binding response OmpR family regulator